VSNADCQCSVHGTISKYFEKWDSKSESEGFLDRRATRDLPREVSSPYRHCRTEIDRPEVIGGSDGTHKQPSTRDERGDPAQRQIDGHKVVLAPHDVKYSREDHDQRQAEGSKRHELRFDSGHRRQDQADAFKKLTDPDEDEQVLRHRGKPRHVLERLVPQGRLATADTAETGEAEEDAPCTVQSAVFNGHGAGNLPGAAWLLSTLMLLGAAVVTLRVTADAPPSGIFGLRGDANGSFIPG
jgi:hypothetical protein